MRLVITNEVSKKYPNLKLGYIIGVGIDNKGNNESLRQLTDSIEQKIRDEIPDVESLQNKSLINVWQSVYRDLGSKPNKYRPTVEALMRRIIRGDSLPVINKAVNSYLLAEIQTLMPLGGYDLKNIKGDILLKISPGGEHFIDMNGMIEDTYEGEFVYADEDKILTRRWNYRDCRDAQITENTTDFILVTELPSNEVDIEMLDNVLNLTKNYIERFCGGSLETGVVGLTENQ